MDESKRQHIISEARKSLRRSDNTEEVFEIFCIAVCSFIEIQIQ